MLDLEDDMDVWQDIIYNHKHTLFPVCDGTPDKIVGILNAKEYFRLDDKSRETVIAEAVKPAYFVPNMIKADTLFRNMKKERQPMAIVLNEYGGVIGIVTIHDLVEQLVGDLIYEEDEEEILIQQVNENTWNIRGAALLEDISEALGIVLSCEEYDTFNGLIFHTLESIPEEDEEMELEIARIHVKVLEIKNHQVEMARVTVREKETEAEVFSDGKA
jgi:putative hemolysin